MTDVQTRCPKCGAAARVSDLAETYLCGSCGTRVSVPAAPPSETSQSRLRLRTADESGRAPPPQKMEEKVDLRNVVVAETKARKAPKGEAALTMHHLGSWLVFIALGGAMGAARYGGILPLNYAANLEMAAPFVLLVVHLVIVLTAFNDTVFSGILALLIPPYAYFYLFSVSDSFYLRALAGGLLVGTAQDGCLFLQQKVTAFVDWVNAYIAAGGW